MSFIKSQKRTMKTMFIISLLILFALGILLPIWHLMPVFGACLLALFVTFLILAVFEGAMDDDSMAKQRIDTAFYAITCYCIALASGFVVYVGVLLIQKM